MSTNPFSLPARVTRSMGLKQDPEGNDEKDGKQEKAPEQDLQDKEVIHAHDLRILSWNMGKASSEKGLTAKKLVKMLKGLKANVLIAQEPPLFVQDFATRKQSTESEWHGQMLGTGQGTIVVIYRNGEVTCSQLKALDPVGVGQGTNCISEENPIVCFTISGLQKTTVKVATFHSPYDASARSVFAKRACEQAKKDGADIVIGDFNTYGISCPIRGDYSMFLALPTSGMSSKFGTDTGSSPLDKIVAKDTLLNCRRGRVIPKKGADKPQTNPSRSVVDLTMSEWGDKFAVPSDHLPIYIDVGPLQTDREAKSIEDSEKTDARAPKKLKSGEQNDGN